MMRKAFTLMEVNLAILIMAGGILAMVSLYSLGYRESRASGEDVVGAAYADAILDPFVAALSGTNVTWDSFSSIPTTPANGWGDFIDQDTGKIQAGQLKQNFSLSSYLGSVSRGKVKDPPRLDSSLWGALVVVHEQGSPVVSLALRITQQKQLLFSQPIYYTEVRYQGEVNP